MKIYISADMEGATGVVHSRQTDHREPEYAFGRKMQLHDVRVVVKGALDAGADEILINDSHWRMINLDISELGFDSRVRLISGASKTLCMVEGLQGYDAAFFVGYHAKAGTPRAIIDHTMSDAIYSISLNGREVGETGLNAAVCAACGVPVALVTGDTALCAEAVELLGDGLVAAGVKEARGCQAATCLLPEESGPLLKEAASKATERARSGGAPVMDIGDGSFDLRLTFRSAAQCDNAAVAPGSERIDGRTLRITGSGMTDMMRWTLALISLSS
ncbi:MAG: M55 family metallopeptidase [Synergistaceae bacterium]|jgi:D-amino peptidase|nr:M55 family metallopeptidase [Synergistaceae bacterium]